MTGPQGPRSPKDRKEKTNPDETNAENSVPSTGGNHVPPRPQPDHREHNNGPPNRTNYISYLALGIAIISAGVAVWSVWEAHDTARKQLRAYVDAVPLNVFHIDDGNPLEAYVRIRNTVQTFALDIERYVGIKIFRPPELPEEVSDLMELEPGKFVIGPGGDNVTFRRGPKLIKEQFDKIKTRYDLRTDDKDLRIYVIGMITYKDVWDDFHKTDFCFMFFGDEHVPNYEPFAYGRIHGKYCDKHNNAY